MYDPEPDGMTLQLPLAVFGAVGGALEDHARDPADESGGQLRDVLLEHGALALEPGLAAQGHPLVGRPRSTGRR